MEKILLKNINFYRHSRHEYERIQHDLTSPLATAKLNAREIYWHVIHVCYVT